MAQNPTIDQLVKMLADQQKMVQDQSQQIAQLIAIRQNAPNAAAQPNQGANSVPILPDISPFEPTDDKSRISEWIERFKFALDCTAPTANDEVKVKCLMNKLSESAFSEYSRSVLPSSVTDFDFKVTTEKLEKLFAKAQSIFIDRYECLKAVRGEGEQFRQFINRHRKLLTDFKFDELTKEQFNCLMLLMALKAPNEAALRQRILTKLSADGANISYDGVVEDLISFQSTISEAKAIEATSSSRPVNSIRQNSKPNNSPNKFFKESPKPNILPNKFKERINTEATTTCWRCGFGVHRPDECRYKTSKTNHLKEVFGRIQAYGFRVKLAKCKFFRDQIKYLGQIIDKNGRRPDPAKIYAISQMPVPNDIPSLRSFLGMVNHYQQYVKNMRFIRKPLDDLLKKEIDWSWSEGCENAFRKIKEILASDLLLTHYDPKMDIIVAADASELGIGAVIYHKFPDGNIKAIAHASKSLAPAEKNYSQIEKEGLALIFAVQKFHKMIYGRHFTLQTDHKPLVSIFGSKKGIRQCSANRLLRWSLILLAYDFTIEYINTKDFGQADALSRLIAKGNENEDEKIIAMINAETDFETNFGITISKLPLKFSDLVAASERDENIIQVQKFVKNGWPNEKAIDKENQNVRDFCRRKEELSIEKGCLMFGERAIIPKVFQSKILNLLHKGHPGMKRMKQLARQYVFWPKIDQDIEDYVRECVPCQAAAKAPIKTNLQSWPKTSGPWQRVHMDFAGPFFGKYFLIVVDSYSKYPEVFEMSTISTAMTIEKLRYLASRHGIPETLVSDNGTQFKSSEFAKFTAANGINHLFSAPYHPMSNGQAERFVDTFKRAFRKLKGEGMSSVKEIIETFLITYRTTPNDSLPDSKSPAEMLIGRKPRTTLDLLKPPPIQPIEHDQAMEKKFNRRFGTRPQIFASKDAVWARHRLSQNWKAGTICGCSGVIYNVRFEDGSSGRYHANQLRLRKATQNVEDPLNILNEEFNLPIQMAPMVNGQQNGQVLENRPDPVNAEDEVEEPPIRDEQQDAIQAVRSPMPQRRYPDRRRQPPVRFSPR